MKSNVNGVEKDIFGQQDSILHFVRKKCVINVYKLMDDLYIWLNQFWGVLEIENNQPFPETDFKGDIWTIEAK